MNENINKELEQEIELHTRTKILLEKVMIEKNQLKKRIETLVENISTMFSKFLFLMSIPINIGMLNFIVIIRLQPNNLILTIQIIVSVLIIFFSLYIALTGKGLVKKLKKTFRNFLEKLIEGEVFLKHL